MKILFSGHHNPHFITITEYLESAIRSLGHELFVFEDRQHVVPGRIRKRLPFLRRLDLCVINKRLLSLAEKAQPDIAIMTGGHRIASKTVEKLKEQDIECILWTIDAPLNFQPIIEVAPHYDHIFCQGTEANELLEKAGITGTHRLPMACDPFYHHPVDVTEQEKKRYGNDLAFVGSFYPSRAELLEGLVDFDLGIWGPGWNTLSEESSLKECVRGFHVAPDIWKKIYSASKIIIATHYHDPENRFSVYQASPRVFEALACGAFVICDDQRDVFSLFKEGEDLVKFKDVDDLANKIKYYLTHPEESKAIAAKGRQNVLENHTYVHRMKKLLANIGCEA